ncbi:MAG: restriction endonuclease subunit S [Vicinamibacteria bacterium]
MEGWRNLKLGEVLKLEYGKPLPAKRRTDDGKFPAYGANGIKCRTNDVYWEEPSIIVGRKGSAGEINLVDGGFWPLDVTYFVVFDERQYDLRFLYYLLSRLNLPSLAKGVKPGLNRNDVYAIVQWLPPLPEQERIVAILDEAFAAIATATANAEKNVANAQELGPSSFREILASAGDDWCSSTIGEQVLLQRGFDITKKQQLPGEVPVISSGGTKSHHAEARVLGPGVVIGRKGSIGSVHYVSEDFWPHDTTLFVKDFRGNNPRFVYHFFNAMNLARLDSGAANPALNRNLIHPLPVTWPSTELQPKLALQADRVVSMAESLGRKYDDKRQLLTELKESILNEAFTGELTADPNAADRTLSEAGA